METHQFANGAQARGVFPEKYIRRSSKALLLDRFCRNFGPAAGLSVQECRSLLGREQAYFCNAGRTLIAPGVASRPKIVLSGWACLQQILENGRRQIFSFVVPGDLIGFAGNGSQFANIVALTPMVVLDAPQLHNAGCVSDGHPQVRKAVVDIERRQTTYIYRQIVRLGCHAAYEGLHDLLQELFERLSQAGLACSGGVPFPLTQEVLGDALGLSAVHINRTMQQMRRSGLMELERARLVLRQPLDR